MQVIRTATMRELDARTIGEYGVSSLDLMERAGRGCAEAILQRYPDIERRDVHVLCGRGNNGGDGFVIARYLAAEGVRVRVYATHDPAACSDDCRTNWERLPADVLVVPLAQNRELPDFASLLAPRDLVIDALLGVGIRSPLESPYRELVLALQGTPAQVIAIDVPTGVGEDNGQITDPCITAHWTLTIGFPKVGLYLEPAALHTGPIDVIPLDYPAPLLADYPASLQIPDPASIAAHLVARRPDSHKGTYGRLLILGGSRGMSGSVALAAEAAFRSGAGMLAVATAASAQPIVAGHLREMMTIPLPETPDGVISPLALPTLLPWLDWATTLAFGPGLTTQPAVRALVGAVLDHWAGPLVLDADALKIAGQHLGRLAGRDVPAICTPHLAEAAALLGIAQAAISTRRLDTALEAAERHQIVLLLKGYRTVIAAPTGEAVISTVGNPGLASAGTGDVLTGIIGGLLAQGLSPFEAAWVGTWLHGKAADQAALRVGEISLMARDVIRALPATLLALPQ